METVEVKFGDWIQKGFDLFKSNAGVLIPALLVAYLLSAVTIGILAGPMWVGMILITFALIDKKEPKPTIGDVFKGFAYFLPSFLFMLLFGIAAMVVSLILMWIPCIGMLLNMLLLIAASTAVMFTLFLIADRKLDFIPAIRESWAMVKKNFWQFLALNLVAAVIGSIGSVVCGIGAIITMPLYFTIMATAYRELFGPAATPATT